MRYSLQTLVLFTWFFLFSLLLWPQITNGSCFSVYLSVVKILRDTATGVGELLQHIIGAVMVKAPPVCVSSYTLSCSLCKQETDNYSSCLSFFFCLCLRPFSSGLCSSFLFFNIPFQLLFSYFCFRSYPVFVFFLTRLFLIPVFSIPLYFYSFFTMFSFLCTL